MDASTSSSITTLSYSLQINVISAESLTMGGKKPVRKNLFVTISTKDDYNHDNDDDQVHSYYGNHQLSTRFCQEGYGTLFAWGEKLETDVPMHVKFIVLNVRCATRSGDKSIGVAKVPVSDFVGGSLPRDYLHFLSYRLRDRYGNPNGIINFSVKVVKFKGFDYLKTGDYQSCKASNNGGGGGGLVMGSLGYGVSKGKPWQETGLVVDWRRNNSDHAVGVPAAWLN